MSREGSPSGSRRKSSNTTILTSAGGQCGSSAMKARSRRSSRGCSLNLHRATNHTSSIPHALVSRHVLPLDLRLLDRPASPTTASQSLRKVLAHFWRSDTADVGLIRVRMRLGESAAHHRALELASDVHSSLTL